MIVHYYANHRQEALSACGLYKNVSMVIAGSLTLDRLRVSCPVCIATMEGC